MKPARLAAILALFAGASMTSAAPVHRAVLLQERAHEGAFDAQARPAFISLAAAELAKGKVATYMAIDDAESRYTCVELSSSEDATAFLDKANVVIRRSPVYITLVELSLAETCEKPKPGPEPIPGGCFH